MLYSRHSKSLLRNHTSVIVLTFCPLTFLSTKSRDLSLYARIQIIPKCVKIVKNEFGFVGKSEQMRILLCIFRGSIERGRTQSKMRIPTIANICGVRWQSEARLHGETVFLFSSIQNQTENVGCLLQVCRDTFATESELKSHENLHKHPGGYVCSMCDEKFRNDAACIRHQTTIHQVCFCLCPVYHRNWCHCPHCHSP